MNNSMATLKQLQGFNAEPVKRNEPLINIGVGFHTGNLMLGIVGEQERMQGDIFSDAVNLTDRIKSLCKFCGASIVVSEVTLNKLTNRNNYHTRFLGKVQVKGKDVPISMYEVHDGDPEPIIELRLNTKADFEDGLRGYFEKEFSDASVCFNKVLKVNPVDKTHDSISNARRNSWGRAWRRWSKNKRLEKLSFGVERISKATSLVASTASAIYWGIFLPPDLSAVVHDVEHSLVCYDPAKIRILLQAYWQFSIVSLIK